MGMLKNVIPAKAGIHKLSKSLDPDFRRDDEYVKYGSGCSINSIRSLRDNLRFRKRCLRGRRWRYLLRPTSVLEKFAIVGADDTVCKADETTGFSNQSGADLFYNRSLKEPSFHDFFFEVLVPTGSHYYCPAEGHR